MEGSGSKKLVFFYEKYEAVSGALIFYMRIAQFIAHNSDYEVFYVNYKNMPNILPQDLGLSVNINTLISITFFIAFM